MNKRLKPLDIARVGSNQSIQPQTRFGDLSDRPKTPRLGSARFTKQGYQSLKPHQLFRVRNSVADLVKRELDDYDRCTFFQRVFILAKNTIMTESIESSVTSILDKYMQSKTNLSENVHFEEEQFEELGEEERESEFGEEEIEQRTDVESRFSEPEPKSPLRESLLQITKSDLQMAYKEKRYRELDFFEFFHKRIEAIVKKCEFEQLSDDQLTGLLLCMGNSHTLFVLEGTEDSVAAFCNELLRTCSDCLDTARIFQVEDRIEETYFKTFLYRRTVAMNINEKFPPPTANDPQLMGSQHWLIKEKLRTICQTLSDELRPKVVAPTARITELFLLPLEEEVDETPLRKKKLRRHRKKSPKRGKKSTTAVEEVSKEDNEEKEGEEGEERRDTTASLRFRMTEKRESGILQKPEEPIVDKTDADANESEKATAPPRVSKARKESVKSVAQSEHEERKSSILEIGEEEEIVEEKEEEILAEPLTPFTLKPSKYIRLLPEVQRIELVLTSKRFYLELEEFIRFSNEVPMQEDEDALIWPTSFSYLPLNVFDRQPFDVNLTFGNYDVKETDQDESTSSEEEGK